MRVFIILAMLIHSAHGDTYTSTSSKYIAYVLIAGSELAWLEANEYCASTHGTTLATILNKADQTEIVNLLATLPGAVSDAMHVGWETVTDTNKQWWPCSRLISSCPTNWECWAGDELAATSWHDAEITYDEGKCGIIKSNTGAIGRWMDMGCTVKRDFICNHHNGVYADTKNLILDNCGAPPTPQPTNKPTPKPTTKPTTKPTPKPTNKPTNKPTPKPTNRPTNNPTKRPTKHPTKHPSKSPTQSPSDPTKTPSEAPSNAPTETPSVSPSSAPTQPPTNAPTGSPTACVMYNDGDSLIDGVDYIQSANITKNGKNKIGFEDQMTMFKNKTVSRYIGIGSDTFFADIISCNDTDSNLCYIGCYYSGFCAYASIVPKIYNAGSLIISCDHKKACTGANVFIDAETKIDDITILCSTQLSCNSMSVSINSSFSTSLNIECNEILSCHKLSVQLFGDTMNNENDTLSASITCFEGSSCGKMTINTDNSSKINLTLNMHQFSHKISIVYEHYKDLNLNCGFEGDHRYIRYSRDDPLDSAELLRVARLEYPQTLKLPCEDIHVDCTGFNITDFDRECDFDYLFTSDFDLGSILSSDTDCFWIDIMPLLKAQCIGSCEERMRYYPHNVSFTFDVTFKTENETKIQQICDAYFNDTNRSIKTMNDIDAIFDYVITVAKGLSGDTNTIHNVLESPDTQFEDENVTKLYCHDMEAMLFSLEPLQLNTELVLESTIKNGDEINVLFSTESTFIRESEALISELFGIGVTLTSYISVVRNSKYIPKKYTLYAIIIAAATLLLIVILIATVYHYCAQNKLRKLERAKNIICMKYPMIVAIAVGVYDWSIYRNLDVDVDIRNISILCDLLGYKLKPAFKKGESCKLYWTQEEILSFLEKKAADFNKQVILGKYDGLIVIMSGHGIKDHIVSSDCHKIEKNAIHRMFSEKYVEARTVPRIFMFDSCSGADARNPVPREFDEDDEDDDERNTEGFNASTATTNEENKLEQTKSGRIQLERSKTVKLTETTDQWHHGENNPDYGLVTILAANAGFQAKMDSITGSYLISQFVQRVIRNIENGNHLLLGDIFDLIQSDLHEKGKQQTVNTFNNKTRYIKMDTKHVQKKEEEEDKFVLVLSSGSKKQTKQKEPKNAKESKKKQAKMAVAKKKKKKNEKEKEFKEEEEEESRKKEEKKKEAKKEQPKKNVKKKQAKKGNQNKKKKKKKKKNENKIQQMVQIASVESVAK